MQDLHQFPSATPGEPSAPVPMLTLPAVAAWLNVSERAVRGLVRREAIPVFRVGRALRFHPGEIELWLSQQRRGNATTCGSAPLDQGQLRDHDDVARRLSLLAVWPS